MRTWRFGLFGLVGAALLAACGSDPASTDADLLFEVDASDGSRAELGIVAWRGTSASDGATTIRGVDASGATVFELETIVASTPEGKHVRQRASRGSESAAADIAPNGTGDDATYTITNGMADASPALRHAVVRLLADLEADRPATGSTALVAPKDTNGSQPLVGHCGFLVRCNTPPLVACTGGAVGIMVTCPTSLAVAAKKALIDGLGFGTDDPTQAAKDQAASCGKSVANAVDACDTTQSKRNGCQYGGTNGCPDVDAGAPDQACSPACDTNHSCVAMQPGDYGVPVTNGHGCLAN
jgi:hypothetical protein